MHLWPQINQPWYFWRIATVLAFLLKLFDKTSLNPTKIKATVLGGGGVWWVFFLFSVEVSNQPTNQPKNCIKARVSAVSYMARAATLKNIFSTDYGLNCFIKVIYLFIYIYLYTTLKWGVQTGASYSGPILKALNRSI